ncbi:MAG: hypothetical protein AB8U25_05260 [Rickettsiales endosymbiont of Dermacentor nuttalli]
MFPEKEISYVKARINNCLDWFYNDTDKTVNYLLHAVEGDKMKFWVIQIAFFIVKLTLI